MEIECLDVLKELVENLQYKHIKSEDWKQGYLSVLRDIIYLFEENTLRENCRPANNEDREKFKEEDVELVSLFKLFDKEYPIYVDDYGQCLGSVINSTYRSYGSYNVNILTSLVYDIFNEEIIK